MVQRASNSIRTDLQNYKDVSIREANTHTILSSTSRKLIARSEHGSKNTSTEFTHT